MNNMDIEKFYNIIYFNNKYYLIKLFLNLVNKLYNYN